MSLPFIVNIKKSGWEVTNELVINTYNLSDFIPKYKLPLKIKIKKYVSDEISYETNIWDDSWMYKKDFYFENIEIYTNDDYLIWCRKWDPIVDESYELFNFLTSHKKTSGVVIGCHDGLFGEWVTKVDGKNNIVLIEASKKQFEKLSNTYKNKNNVTILNNLVSDKNENIKFYESEIGYFNSVNKEHLSKYANKISEYDLESITIKNIISNFFNGEKIDWIHIDTEGHDAKIILSFKDFTEYLPSVICYEYTHIDLDEKFELEKFLNKNNYKINYFKDNAIAHRL